MRIEQLIYFLEVAKCESISQAAQNLFIGHSTLSTSISSLENELQDNLFHRTNKGIFLTERGKQILPDVEHIIQHSQRLKKNEPEFNINAKKHIHLPTYAAGCLSVMVSITNDLLIDYPDTAVHIYETKSENLLKSLIASNGLIALGALTPVKFYATQVEAKNRDFDCQKLFTDRFAVYLPTSHPLATESHLSLPQIQAVPAVMLRSWIIPSENSYYQEFHSLNTVCSVSNFESLKKMMLNQGFITLAPTLGFYQDIYVQSGLIKQIPLADVNLTLVNFVLQPENHLLLDPIHQEILLKIQAFFKNYTA